MIFVFQSIAIACLLIIATYPPIWLLVIVFITRGATMNASQPLSRSILMDTVPKKHRGKVNSMEAIAWGLFWNISAAIGGFLIGPDNNFRLCYLVTSGLYVFGTLLILLLIPLVKRETEAL
jgi:MFS family permease